MLSPANVALSRASRCTQKGSQCIPPRVSIPLQAHPFSIGTLCQPFNRTVVQVHGSWTCVPGNANFFFVLIPIAPSLVALLAVALALFLPWGVRFCFNLWFVILVGLQLFMDCASAIASTDAAFRPFPFATSASLQLLFCSLFVTFLLRCTLVRLLVSLETLQSQWRFFPFQVLPVSSS